MTALLLKLTLAPALVAIASLVAKRMGHRAGGLISGLPVVAAPVVLIFAVERGDGFAREAGASACLGVASSVAFCVAYALTAVRRGPAPALVVASVAFAASTLALTQLDPPLFLKASVASASIAWGSWILRRQTPEASEARPSSDLLAWRLVLTAALVLALTAAATGLSAHLAGLLVPLPIITGVMAGFTHARAHTPAECWSRNCPPKIEAKPGSHYSPANREPETDPIRTRSRHILWAPVTSKTIARPSIFVC